MACQNAHKQGMLKRKVYIPISLHLHTLLWKDVVMDDKPVNIYLHLCNIPCLCTFWHAYPTSLLTFPLLYMIMLIESSLVYNDCCYVQFSVDRTFSTDKTWSVWPAHPNMRSPSPVLVQTSHCMAGLTSVTSFDIDITQVEIDILPVCPCVNQYVFWYNSYTKILDYTQFVQVD